MFQICHHFENHDIVNKTIFQRMCNEIFQSAFNHKMQN